LLDDKRPINFSYPSSATSHIARVLPALPMPPPLEAGTGSSQASLEEAMLRALKGKPYFVKAWLPDEQLYLLANHDGFLVSYLTLGQVEVERLCWRAQQDDKGASSDIGGQPNASIQNETYSAQATWLQREQAAIENAANDDASPLALQHKGSVEITSLGDTDIVGLTEALSYAQSYIKGQLNTINRSKMPKSSRRVESQIQRLLAEMEKLQKKSNCRKKSGSSPGMRSFRNDNSSSQKSLAARVARCAAEAVSSRLSRKSKARPSCELGKHASQDMMDDEVCVSAGSRW